MKRVLCVCLVVLLFLGAVTPAALAVGGGDAYAEPTSVFRTEPMISAGRGHTVALRSDGTVWTWGSSFYDQLGDSSSTSYHATPVQVRTLTNIIAVAAGGEGHTVALRSDGTVWTFGRNDHGQLGDSTTTNRHTPVQVQSLTNITAISAGLQYTVALRNDGTAWAWGRNNHGQLGDGTTTDRHAPVQVQTLTNVAAVSAGGWHTVALRNDGTIWAWGWNGVGQLGDSTTTDRTAPVQTQTLTNVTAVSAGLRHTVALQDDGTVWVFGATFYKLDENDASDIHYTPIQVQILSNIIEVSAGGLHTMVLRNDGTIWTWGENFDGQLGNRSVNMSGFNSYITTPIQTQDLTNVTSVSAGHSHTVALRNDGTVWAWGNRSFGLLGINRSDFWAGVNAPAQVLGPDGIGFLNLGVPSQGHTPFTDVPSIAWFHDAVGFVYNRDLMTGTSPTTFAPNTNLTRAMAATIFYRIAGEPDVTYRPVFDDVAGNRWYSNAITWAFDAGIVTGTSSSTFAPSDNITREQFTAMMHRYAQYTGQDVSIPPGFGLGQFTDRDNVSSWAEEAMFWSVYTGLISGHTPTTLAPEGIITRAQCAIILMRYIQAFVE